LGVFLFLMVVLACVYGMFAMYKREIDTCPPWVRRLLATLRSLVLITLAIIFLGPALIRVTSRTIHPVITVLRDASQSMNTADRYLDPAAAASTAQLLGVSASALPEQPPTRAAVLAAHWNHRDQALPRGLTQRGRVRVVDFAEHSSLAGTLAPADEAATQADPPPSAAPPNTASDSGENVPATPEKETSPVLWPWPELAATGRSTDLAGAIEEAVDTDQPAAIVIYTDGQHTGKDDPRAAARRAKEQGIPLLVVGLGDASRPRDVRVVNVYVRPQIWTEEPFEVEAVVAAQGLEGEEVNLELIGKRLSDSDGSASAGTVVARQSVRFESGTGSVPARFQHAVREAGRYVYTVRAQPLEGELSDQDNQLDSPPARVLSREKIRVLLVAGAPTWEFRLVEKLLQREKSMVLSCWLQTLDEGRAQEGTRPITHLPVTKDELFWYDVVLLFDPDPKEFDQDWLKLLEEFVGNHAGGLLFMAGPKFTSSLLTNARTQALRSLLPVSFGDVGAMEVSSLLSVNSQAWPLRVAPTGMDHPVMTFFSDRQETLRRWETLPGIFWSFPAAEAKPTAQVLVEHSDPTLRSVEGPRPLLVASRYGAGQVLYLGFNGTWRWRKAGSQAEFFDKFWIQAVRHLVEARSLEGRRRGTLQTDRDRYELGDKVMLTARLQDSSYQPLSAENVTVTALVEGEPPINVVLLPLARESGTFEGTYLPRKPGKYQLTVRVPGVASEETLLEAPFQVDLPAVETSQVWLNQPLLADLAALSGGRYFSPGQVEELLAAVPDKTETLESRGPPEPLWDTSWMLAWLVALLGTEWWIRKHFKLL
jgi:hypothetical protein